MKNHKKFLDILEAEEDLGKINSLLQARTGIVEFFRSKEQVENFKKQVITGLIYEDKGEKDGTGDFQTPRSLADRICQVLAELGTHPSILIEPTVGIGNFVISALKQFPGIKKVYSVELQEGHEWFFKHNIMKWALSSDRKALPTIEFHQDDIFSHEFPCKILRHNSSDSGEILILGNPPWMTSAGLSVLGSMNVPEKSNIYNHKGIEALTGKGNFDIGEAVLMKMIDAFRGRNAKIGMLCKTAVIRKILKGAKKKRMAISNIKAINIDARKEFGINADASLFVAYLCKHGDLTCEFSTMDAPLEPSHSFGWVDDKFVSNVALYQKHQHLDGKCPFEWRQGVKHDAIKVMVLFRNTDETYSNGLGETIELEDQLIYPFLRGADLKEKVVKDSGKYVIIPQQKLNQDTSFIATQYPKIWNYLQTHGEALDGRKSRIYNGKPRFSIFGIGDYAFKPFKVGIAGLYKEPSFSLIHPIKGKPAMLDDTCYYLHFDTLEMAENVWKLLNSSDLKDFLNSIAFLDAKRPFKKEILSRVDINQLAIINKQSS